MRVRMHEDEVDVDEALVQRLLADQLPDLADLPLRILPGFEIPDARVARGPRVGITRAVEHPLRFWVSDSPAVSGRRSTSRT